MVDEQNQRRLREIFDLLTPYKDDNIDIATARNLVLAMIKPIDEFREGWQQAMSGQTHPIDELWDEEDMTW